jgi:dTDP-glucose 4,6-dehydratase/UDP-glucose 4-epimerase
MISILILGSEGFIGSHLVRYFKNNGYEVYGCDLVSTASCPYHYTKISKEMPEWETVFSGNHFSFCINASGSGNVNYSVTHPFTDFESNTLDTIRILESIRLYNPDCRYLHISSAAVYGNPALLPVTENASCDPLSPYGWHKLIAEQLCKEYNSIYKIPITIVRPFSIYGPGLKKQLFWDIYQQTLADGQEIALWGTGKESRDFIFIDDVMRCFHLILEHAAMNGEIYNLASGTETSIADAVNIFFKKMGLHPEVVFNKQVREGDPLNWKADISMIRSLGFDPAVSLDKGIESLVKWLKASL